MAKSKSYIKSIYAAGGENVNLRTTLGDLRGKAIGKVVHTFCRWWRNRVFGRCCSGGKANIGKICGSLKVVIKAVNPFL